MKQTARVAAADTATSKSVDQQAAQIGLGVIIAVIILSSIWSVACLLGAISQYGIIRTIAGWWEAIF